MNSKASGVFAQYRKKTLFLLIGTNPLPNYVAALLLAQDGGNVHLLHTSATEMIAQLLSCQIKRKRPSLNVDPYEIHAADGSAISAQLETILDKTRPPQDSVGFNYTGGTKPMAVHVFGGLCSRFPTACLSYLDARSLKMYINQGKEPTQV